MDMNGFIGEIRLFTGRYVPRGWLFCDGSQVSIAQYQALYAVISIIYGPYTGTTFTLPDLRGRAPIGVGTGTNLTPRPAGAQVGAISETLTLEQMPKHTHAVKAKSTTTPATLTNNPQGNVWAKTNTNVKIYGDTTNTAMDPRTVGSFAGGGKAHNNIQPCIGLQYIICWDGCFPAPD